MGIDECVNSEAVGLSCSESYVALAEKFQINARSGNLGSWFMVEPVQNYKILRFNLTYSLDCS